MEDKLPNLGRRVEKAITKELNAEVRREAKVSIEAVPTPQAPATEEAAPSNPQPEPKEPKDEPKEPKEPKDEPKEPKALTEEDIRAYMHRTRQRIEGEDYKDHSDSELYKKYHKALTSEFKKIAVTLGADKPSTLPVDKRAQFMQMCDELMVSEDGSIISVTPF